jgi:hypothetical protein
MSQAGIPGRVLAQARRLERGLPGRSVAEECWDILAGRRAGAIAWADYQRMLDCLEAAASQPRFACAAIAKSALS